MARARRQSFRPPRPARGWAGVIGATEISVPANSRVLLGSFVVPGDGAGLTVIRTVGQFSISSDQQATTEQQIGAFGLIVATDAALAVGITALPDPVTEIADDGWFVYRSFSQDFRFITAAGVMPDFAMPYEFDSKAKRKI